jgi:histidine ammonia-lyase
MSHKENASNSYHPLYLDGYSLSISNIYHLANQPDLQVAIKEEVADRINASRHLLEKFVDQNRIIYGVNTSLGGFVNWLIPTQYAQELQENLIAAVATNVGPYLEDNVVRATLLARLNSLARGTSAISLENFNKLLNMFNAGIIPCIPSKGSLGASGDLGPLACIALVATGKWKAKYQNQTVSGKEALQRAGIDPMQLNFKEGLSLINGTSAMAGLASLLVEQSIQLVKTYDVISCLTFEGLKAKKKPFNPIVHRQKPHLGQLQTAENIWNFLRDSQMIVDEEAIEKQLQTHFDSTPTSTEVPIEDSYAIRCTPQIIGPIRDNLKWIETIVTNEVNSSNDNPLILVDEEDIFHNGHFHGQYLSLAMDHLSICLTTLSNLSDRRIDRFMDKHHSNQLPPFLCKEKPGLRLGLMGGQFMATSLTAENRSLCCPVSIQSLTSTGDFQDIVSLGLVAARRAQEILDNTSYILAFELLCGAQAAEIRGIHFLGSMTRKMVEFVREYVPYLTKDECLTDFTEDLAKLIKSGNLLKKIENLYGEIPF